MKRCIAELLVTTLAALAIYLAEERRISRLQTENQNLTANQTPTTPRQPPAIALTKAERDELEQLRKSTPELLRLRGEVTLLRQARDAQGQQLASSASGPVHARPAGGFLSKEQLVNAGTATPEASLQTFIAGVASGNFDVVLATMLPDGTGDTDGSRATFEKAFQQERARLKGIQPTAKRVLSDDRVELQVLMFEEGKAPVLTINRMVKIGNEWRLDQSIDDAEEWQREGQVQLFTPTE